ncbi:MAG: hypothetical protein NZL89_05085 [Leptospiraceae bacterium]|nr:hypothetical protein [Leptospiraceae bacterium]
MQPVKVIHLIKRVEQIDQEIAELHKLVAGIDSSRSYRNALKIAAEKQINDLIGEKVKLMELRIENPPEFLVRHVYPEEAKTLNLPRISLEALQSGMSSTYVRPAERGPSKEASKEESSSQNPLHAYTRMMNVKEILSKPSEERRREKPVKSRAEILRDLPPLQY